MRRDPRCGLEGRREMPASLTEWLAMGGYAAYVWPAYGVTALVIGALALVSLVEARSVRRDLERLQRQKLGGEDSSS